MPRKKEIVLFLVKMNSQTRVLVGLSATKNTNDDDADDDEDDAANG